MREPLIPPDGGGHTPGHGDGEAEAPSEHPAAGRAGWAILAAYAALMALLVPRHEPWRDELQAWGIARASNSLAELFANMRHEAHPPLWHLPLWALSRVTADPIAMQVLAALIGLATVVVLVRWSPFTRLQQALIAGGYMLAYEFAVVARSYGLGALLTFVACALWPRRHAHAWALGLALGLLALTSAYGVVVVGAFAAALAAEERRTGAWRAAFGRAPDNVGAGLGLALTGLCASIALMWPPDDFFPGAGDPGVGTLAAWAGALERVGWAFCPLPASLAQPWGHPLLGGGVAMVAGLVAVALVHALALRGRPAASACFWAGTGALVVFAACVYPGGMRHLLHHQLVAIAALWLAASEPARARVAYLHDPRWRRAFVALLVPSVGTAAIVASADARSPFSNARAMAAWMGANRIPPDATFGAPDFAAVPVSTWLVRPLHALPGGPVPFVAWTRRRIDTLADPARLWGPAAAASRAGAPYFLLTNAPLSSAVTAHFGPATAGLLHAETGALVPDENYWLYRITPAHGHVPGVAPAL